MQDLGKEKKKRGIVVATTTAPILFVVVVVFALTSAIDYKLNRDAEQRVIVVTSQAAENVADHRRSIENAIRAFVALSLDSHKLLPALDALQKQMGFLSVAFAGVDGTGITSGGAAFDISQLGCEETALSQGVFSYSEMFVKDRDLPVCMAQKPLYIDGVLAGALYVQIPMELFVTSDYLEASVNCGHSFLFDGRSGEILLDLLGADEDLIGKGDGLYRVLEKLSCRNLFQVRETQTGLVRMFFAEIFGDGTDQKDYSALHKAVEGGKSALMVASLNGEAVYVCTVPAGVGSWWVCNIIPMKYIRAETGIVTRAFHVVLGIVLVCLGVVGAMRLFIYRRRMHEKNIAMLAQFYEALSDSVDLSVNLYFPKEGTVTPFVAKEADMLGCSLEKFLKGGRCFDEVMLSQTGRNFFDRLRKGLIDGFEQGEFSLQPHGCTRWVSYSARCLTFEGKQQILVVLRDSTQDKQIQLSMKDAMHTAEAANQAKTDFLSRMSHEIRTPLNVIIGMVQIAWRDTDNAKKMKDDLAKIGLASQHLLALVDDILDLSKIEDGKMTLSLEAFRLSDVIDQVINTIRPSCEQRQQNLVVQSDPQASGIFLFDPLRLKQLLLNLLSNASKYTPDKGCIRLETKLSSGPVLGCRQITFVVSDNGIGMSKDFLDRLFEPFAMEGRLQEQGSGLGMSIVKNIVSMMGGVIEVDSALGKGSTFTVVLNLRIACKTQRREFKGAQPSQKRTGAAHKHSVDVYEKDVASADLPLQEPSDLRGDLCGLRVLLAEDNDLNAEIACELLSAAGLKVERAGDGEQACAMFKDSKLGYYDVVLMDVQMPKMNGYDATRCIRGLKRCDAKSVPIIAMSANAFSEDVCASLASGMNAHLSKPIKINHVLDVIAKHVCKYRRALCDETLRPFKDGKDSKDSKDST